MDELKKIFQKLPKKERETLTALLFLLKQKQLHGLNIIKMQGSEYLRLKKGRLRIIFRYDKTGKLAVKRVRMRNEKTYKNL